MLSLMVHVQIKQRWWSTLLPRLTVYVVYLLCYCLCWVLLPLSFCWFVLISSSSLFSVCPLFFSSTLSKWKVLYQKRILTEPCPVLSHPTYENFESVWNRKLLHFFPGWRWKCPSMHCHILWYFVAARQSFHFQGFTIYAKPCWKQMFDIRPKMFHSKVDTNSQKQSSFLFVG